MTFEKVLYTTKAQTHLLQEARQRRALRGVGTSGALPGRAARGIPVAPLIVVGGPDSGLVTV